MQGKILTLSLLLVSSDALAQSAVQQAIANKISFGAPMVKCSSVKGAGDLKGAVCSERPGVPEMNEGSISFNFPNQLEYKEWVKVGESSYFNLWKSSVNKIPIYISPSPNDPNSTLVTVARAGASLPKNDVKQGEWAQPSVPRARAAGASRGAAYTPISDITKFFSIQASGQYITVNFGNQRLSIRLMSNSAKLNGKSVVLQAKPFSIDGKILYPAGIYKLFGCTVKPLVNELGLTNELEVTCSQGSKTKTEFVKNWVF